MIKPSKVKFISEKLEKEFNRLDKTDPLKKSIIRAINDLKQNAFFGIQIQKKLFPEEFIKKYGLNNLWKYDLPNAWRLIYTIKADDIQILNVILEWFDHKEYERKFKY